jgi:hypothetical protein
MVVKGKVGQKAGVGCENRAFCEGEAEGNDTRQQLFGEDIAAV